MGINPDTYAPASPSSAAGAAAAATFPATRHMAQWESARLEAEARLSRESILFSSSAAAALSAADHCTAAAEEEALSAKPESDFFLRMWNSEVGDSFRKPLMRCAVETPIPPAEGTPDPPAATASAEGECRSCVSAGGEAPSGPDSSSSNMVDETSEETYQIYLNLAGDELSLFHGHVGGFSLFSADLSDVFLDTAFK